MKQTRNLLICLCLLVAMLSGTKTYATVYIKDVMLIGGSSSEVNALKTTYQAQGWTVIEYDLNKGAGGDYIYLLFKSENNNGENNGFITDFYITNDVNISVTVQGSGCTIHCNQHYWICLPV